MLESISVKWMHIMISAPTETELFIHCDSDAVHLEDTGSAVILEIVNWRAIQWQALRLTSNTKNRYGPKRRKIGRGIALGKATPAILIIIFVNS